MSKKSKQPGICVFCGRSGVTKQHLWPDWLKSVIPREGQDHSQFLTKIDMSMPGTAVIRPDIQFKRGPFGARKIRNVCAGCNSGWMSKLESAAKPILTNLILGKRLTLDQSDQLALSAWTAMTSIVAEYTDVPTQSIPTEHRQHLMEQGIPPEGWNIWIGAYAGKRWKQRYRHHGLASVPRSSFLNAQPHWGTQFSTFVAGALFIHAASTTALNLIPIFNTAADERLIQIWPIKNPSVAFPTAVILSDEHADHIADALFYRLMGMFKP